ncbi:MAG: 6,7-dimethyl-8-ribityllumazine synthase [Bacteroidetes bacterium]|nr:6,7-dimethyl-8-ribityllumazine synthase [Bacteroidota bacterium]MBS1756761.1 6,7-dimethyl-8-ribityllumazine synthase [Bacteroidota bacterium]
MAVSTPEISNTAGIPLIKDACVVIVHTEWNAAIVDLLVEGCVEVLKQKNVCIKMLQVPGAVEIPFAINHYWHTHQYRDDKPSAFIALGCVLRGGTPHFEYVCNSVTAGITQLNLQLPVPTIFGVLTLNTTQEAEERTGGAHGHKGKEAAATALKMISLVHQNK